MNRRFLAGAQFDDQPAARRQQARRLRGNCAVKVEAVNPAVKRQRGVIKMDIG